MAERPDSTALEAEATARAREARRAAAIGEALSRARHDLNNLFHVATGWSRLLRDPRTGPEEIREGVNAVLASSAGVSQLIGGVLALDGRPSGSATLCDIATKLSELARGAAYLLPVRGRLVLELPEHALVVCNFSELRATLVDFILDLRETLGQGELRLALHHVAPDAEGTAQMELVLERVTRALPSHSPEARLCLRFAAERSTAGASKQPAPTTEPSAVTILLVDDHREVRRLATTMLERAGYQVLTAQDAEEALETSRNYDGPIQILCSDADMPGLPAEQLIKELSAARPELRVLICTGQHRLGKLDHYPRLAKPFSYQQLVAAVRQCLEADPVDPA